jgi:hypothetical protein
MGIAGGPPRSYSAAWRPIADIAALIAVVLVVAWANASDSDVSSQFTLLFLLVGSAVLGYVWGRLWWIPGIVVGATVAVQHVIAVMTHQPEPGTHLPPGWLGAASLLVLLVPALLAALGGALVRRSIRQPHHADR